MVGKEYLILYWYCKMTIKIRQIFYQNIKQNVMEAMIENLNYININNENCTHK